MAFVDALRATTTVVSRERGERKARSEDICACVTGREVIIPLAFRSSFPGRNASAFHSLQPRPGTRHPRVSLQSRIPSHLPPCPSFGGLRICGELNLHTSQLRTVIAHAFDCGSFLRSPSSTFVVPG